MTQPLDRYLGVWDDAVHFEKLLIRVGLGDVKLPHHGGPVALTTAAADIKRKDSRMFKNKPSIVLIRWKEKDATLTQQNSEQL